MRKVLRRVGGKGESLGTVGGKGEGLGRMRADGEGEGMAEGGKGEKFREEDWKGGRGFRGE